MKKFLTLSLIAASLSMQSKAQSLVSNYQFSTYTCGGPSCNLTVFSSYPAASNCADWYALTGTPEIYTGVLAAFMWDGTGAGASESVIQVLPSSLSTGTCYTFSIDAFHNNLRGTGGMIVKLTDGTTTQTLINTAVTNTSYATFSTSFTATANHTRLIIEPDASSGFMDLVVDNVTLRGGTGLSISSANMNFIPGGANSLSVVSGPGTPVYTSYRWYRNGVLVSGPCSGCNTYTPTLPGDYTCIASGPCGEELSNEITLKIDCNLPGMSSYSGSTGLFTSSGGYYVAAGTSVTLSAGTTYFQNTFIVMGNCSEINIPVGASMTLDNVMVVGCDDWKGINVIGSGVARTVPITASSGELETDNGTLISDAEVGVYTHDGGYVELKRTKFENNETHVVMPTYLPTNNSFIQGCHIARTKTNSCVHTYHTTPIGIYEPAVVIKENSTVNIAANVFYKDDAVLSLPVPSGFNNKSSVYLLDCDNIELIENDFYAENIYHVYAEDGNDLYMYDNDFYGHKRSLYYNYLVNAVMLKDEDHVFMDLNRIYHGYNGVEWYNNNNTISNVDRNLFENNDYGIVASNFVNPVTGINASFAVTLHLYMDCNKFWSNGIGILGSGDLVTQGNPGLDAANDFSGNSNWDVLWDYTTPPTYYYSPSPGPSVTGTGLFLNGNLIPTTTGFNTISSGAASGCHGSWKKGPSTAIAETVMANSNVYPNPFTDRLSITLPEAAGEVEIIIMDATGKEIERRKVNAQTTVEFETSEYTAGLYIATIQMADGSRLQHKLVKIQ